MLPAGVRMWCPECTWTCVMRSEGDLPEGVTKVVEGVPWCPNCSLPLAPVASVDTTPRPASGISAAMNLEQIAGKCVEIQREVAELGSDLKYAAETHKDAKKAYEAKLISLSLAVERLGRVMGGEQIEADKPLLELAEQEPGRCQAVTDVDGAAVQCVGEADHGGPHGNGDLSWETATPVPAVMESLRIRLANLHIVVDVAEIDNWTSEEYDAVIRYADMLESDEPLIAARPAFLSIDVPEHITALHANLSRLGILISLGVLCAWTPAEREQAAAWAVRAVDDGDDLTRPAHVPGPPAEQPRAPRRKRSLATA